MAAENEAFNISRRICPSWLEDESERRETEPYVYAQTATGRASGNPGHAKNSWLTGTASRTFLSVSQAILGVQPDFDGLRVQPCLPDELMEYTVRRRFRGAEYVIHVQRTGTWSMTAGGLAVEGNLIPAASTGTRVNVEVTV